MADRSSLPGKKDVARALLLKGAVFVHLDPRREGVVVPPWLRNQPQLVLQLGLDMPIPIPDLRVDDIGVFGTLSFNRNPFTCSVPWDGVFAVVGDDGKGMVWPESMPPEVASEVDREVRRQGMPTRPPRESPETGESNLPRLQRRSSSPTPVPTLIIADQDLEPKARPPSISSAERRPHGTRPSTSRARRAGRRPVKLPPYLKVVK